MTTIKKKSVKKTAAKSPKKSSNKLAIEVAEVISAAPIEEKITKSKTKKADHLKALDLANKILKRLENKEDWTEEDKEQLAKLDKIVAILSKLIPLEGKNKNKPEAKTSAEDSEIIKAFLERNRARN